MPQYLDAAKELCAIYAVFPVSVYDSDGAMVKVPSISNTVAAREGWLVDRKGGHYLASRDPDQVAALWEAARDPDAMIGVSTGASGIVVIDDDLAKKDDDEAQAFVDTWAQELNDTRVHETVSGGRHYIFKAPRLSIRSKKAFEAIDVKGSSGYVVFPPSGGYKVVHDVEPKPMSKELQHALRGAQRAYRQERDSKIGSGASEETLAEQILSAADFHDATLELTQRWAKRGIPPEIRNQWIAEIYDRSIAAIEGHSAHARWKARRKDIARISDGAKGGAGGLTDEARNQLADLAQGLPDLGLGRLMAHTPPDPIDKPDSEPQTQDKAPRFRLKDQKFQTEPFQLVDLSQYAPEPVLLDPSVCREQVTVLFGEGGVGKTTLAYLWALSLATGKAIEGVDPPTQRAGVRVGFWSEDPKRLIEKKVAAAMHTHKIRNDDLGGRLLLFSQRDMPLEAAYLDEETRTAVPNPSQIARLVSANDLDVIILDPFSRLVTELEENNSAHMTAALGALKTVSGLSRGVGVVVIHHGAKAGFGADSSSANARGSTAIMSEARVVVEMKTLPKTEAEKLKIEEEDRGNMVRVSRPKANNAARRFIADLFKIVTVPFNNGRDGYPDEEIATLEPWQMPEQTIERMNIGLADLIDAVEVLQRRLEELGPLGMRSHHAAGNWVGYPLAEFWGLDIGTDIRAAAKVAGQREHLLRIYGVLNALHANGVIRRGGHGKQAIPIWEFSPAWEEKFGALKALGRDLQIPVPQIEKEL